MEFDDEKEIDVDELEEDSGDICPSCSALLLDESSVTEGCNDPLGCASFLDEAVDDDEDSSDEDDDEYIPEDEDEEDDEDLEELDFDDE